MIKYYVQFKRLTGLSDSMWTYEMLFDNKKDAFEYAKQKRRRSRNYDYRVVRYDSESDEVTPEEEVVFDPPKMWP